MSLKIFVTGCAGFVGSNVIISLKEHGYDVGGCDNLKFGLAENIPDNINWKAVGFSEIPTEYLDEFDVLIHCATSNIIYSQNFPIETFNNNALETIKLFERFKRKIIYTSTCSVYNNASVFPIPEDATIHTVNAYDTSKYIAELFLKQRGIYTTLRLSNVYGKHQRPENPYCGVLGKFISLALKNMPLTILGEGSDTRDYTYIDDTVNAIVMAALSPALDTEVNIGTGVETSVKDLGMLVWKTLNKPQRYVRENIRSIDGIRRRCVNVSKAESMLGWKPEVSLEEGIRRTIEWQKGC